MQITYFGNTAFRIKSSEANIALACEASQVKDEEIVIPLNENEKVKASGNQHVFDWPGEYEAKGVSVMVIPVGKEKPSRVVKIISEDISLLHLDGVGEALTEKEEDTIGNVDILLVGIGKNSKLDAKHIKEVIEALEPKIVIPMNYASGEEKEFAQLIGVGESEEEDSLKVKKSDLSMEKVEMVLLRQKK